jgi:hypothetical protein
MKKMLCAMLIFLLLLTPIFLNIPKVGATEHLRHVTQVPEVPREPMPENYTIEDYLNTTNPYSQINPLGEESDQEGGYPFYVLVFGDEEERDIIRADPTNPVSWDGYARLQLERGDESLVANFGIDIRILGFEEWDSDDSIQRMNDPDGPDLCDELLADKEHYLGQWYVGESWSNYVDALIGITDQATPGDPYAIAGLASSHAEMDEGKIFVLLKWQVYWMNDNLVQHEVSHLYYAPDHYDTCCAMAYHTHFQTFIYEDLLWMVFDTIPCALTAYSWCASCHQVIQQHRREYSAPPTLTIAVSGRGTTDPPRGTYTYDYDETVWVEATPALHYDFDYWLVDGAKDYFEVIVVEMDSDHNVIACFSSQGGGHGCPTLLVWKGSDYVDYGVIDIHDVENDVVREVHVQAEDVSVSGHKVKFTLREGWEGLNYSHSLIDQVKLYAVDSEGNRYLCPLIKAKHSEQSKVLFKLLFSDDYRTDTYLMDTIDLTFIVPYPTETIENFTFIIEGHNPLKQ